MTRLLDAGAPPSGPPHPAAGARSASGRLSRRDRPAIVGLDCLFPDADGIEPFWDNVLGRRCSLRRVGDRYVPPAQRDLVPDLLGAPMPAPSVRPQSFRLPPSTVRQLDVRVLPMLHLIGRVLDAAPPVRRESTLLILCSQKAVQPDGALGYVDRRLKLLSIFDELRAPGAVGGGAAAALDRVREAFVARYDARFPAPGFDAFLGESSSLMASLASKVFGLGGGLIALDATCASAVPALQVARDRLASGQNDAALIVALSPELVPSRLHYFSPTIFSPSAVLPFDAAADGTAAGEGIGAVLLKRVGDAEDAGDPVFAVVRGTGFSSDDAGSGFVTPQGEGQVRALRQAYHEAEIEPERIRLVEGHGTGTARGDLVELESLATVFAGQGAPDRRTALGSVKGNIGHLLEAAGMAGLLKTACALSRGVLPPTVFRRPRAELGDRLPRFALLDRPRPWPDGADGARFAAVSAFGFGGINGHLILESHPTTAGPLEAHRPAPTSVPAAPGRTETGTMALETIPTEAGASPPAPRAAVPAASEIEAEVMRIVAGCTGYELSELRPDQDLDADLGIDSLKHVELLLHIGKRFDLAPGEDDQITDYPTIGHLARLVAGRLEAPPPGPALTWPEPERTAPAPVAGPQTPEAPEAPEAPVLAAPAAPADAATLARAVDAVADLRHYEPTWLGPHLRLRADLDLTEDERLALSRALDLPLDGAGDLTIGDLAGLLAPAPAPAPPVAAPAAGTRAAEWVLLYGTATPDDPDLVESLRRRLVASDAAVIAADLPGGSRRFAAVVDRAAPTWPADLAAALARPPSGPDGAESGVWWADAVPGTTPPARSTTASWTT